MNAKRALVVDDSRSARISLQKMLEKYHIAVDFAESGEEALDYLKHHLVDAIFMDHTMPGMDGLETVVAIKSNPRTATIPVMMYTAKEGEVYVSQARALGAIGVLPKQVQPGVLLEMLNKLGLIRDDGEALAVAPGSREPPTGVAMAIAADAGAADAAFASERAPERALEHVPEHVPERARDRARERGPERYVDSALDSEYDQQALGASVQALITKVLNEQHVKLRSDILSAHRDFARQVAAEILAKERPGAAPPVDTVPPVEPAPRSGARLGWLAALALLVVLAGLYWQTRVEGERLGGEVTRLSAVVAERDAAIESMSATRRSDLDAERNRADDRYLELVRTLEWALNQDTQVGFDELAFDDRRAVELETLLEDLLAVGFQGTVQLESHLGEFCLATEPDGDYRLAAPGTALDDCSRLGHPLDESSNAAERQSAAFASFLISSPLVTEKGIEVQVIAHDRESSVPVQAVSTSISSAGEWNEAARRNHRVRFDIIPADG